MLITEAANRKFISHGVELNPWLVLYSRADSILKGVSGQTEFFRKDLWKFNISRYDNIVIFGVEQMVSIILCYNTKIYRNIFNLDRFRSHSSVRSPYS